MNHASKMSLMQSIYDRKVFHYKILDFIGGRKFQKSPPLRLPKSIDLSTDPGLMSYLIACTCSE
jgi:hypothetical protein